MNRIAKQLGNLCHVLSIFGFFIKDRTELCNRFIITAAQKTHVIEKLFGIQIITDHFPIAGNINHIEGVYSVEVIDINSIITVL